MFVKRLELIGFKSFADRAELGISAGVTAVVGPNGSGKSNIADAVRWVLGEQSIRLLRGMKLEDVIFAGSDARKPVNYAEVRLFFDNSDHLLPIDFTEVAVARRVYRSGESEFFINQTACRLKDISELFMDTGMGREAYSVIGQGRIEEILSNKPEDRRGIFEEAAGIVKFKVRRKEAEKKLADADQSLFRVRDLIAELYLQLEPLEQRSQVAIAYQQVLLSEEKLSAAVITAEFDRLLSNNQTLALRMTAHQRKVQEIVDKETAADSELIKLRAQLEESERAVQRVQADRLDATANVEKNEGDLRVHAERQANLTQQWEEGQQLAQKIAQEISVIEAEQVTQNQRQMELDQKANELRIEIKRHQEERLDKNHLQQLRGQLADARSQMIELMRKQAADRNELHNADLQLTQQQRRLERVKMEQGGAAEEALRLMRMHESAKGELQTLDAQIKQLENEQHQHNQAWQVVQGEQRGFQKQAAQIEKSRIELHSRLRALQGMHEARQGFANGPKAVLHAVKKSQVEGVIGAVADLFKVKQAWETAIETALGGSLQNVVTDTEVSARKAIAYLKKNNLGRATFLPLSVLTGRRFPSKDREQVGQVIGFVGIASELVEVEQALVPVAEFLLGQVLVVSNLEVANTVAAKLNHRYRIVTIEGDVVHPGGSMTGGSQSGRGSGLLAINRGIEEVTGELQVVALQLLAIEKDMLIADNKEHEMRKEWNVLEERHHQLERALRERTNEWQMNELTYRRQVESAEMMQIEAVQLENELLEALSKKNRLQQTVTQIAEQVANAETTISELDGQIAVQEAKQEENQDEWTELRVQLAECEEALRSVATSHQRLSQELAQHQDHQQRTSETLATLSARMEVLREQFVQLDAERENCRALFTKAEADLQNAQSTRQHHAEIFAKFEDQVQVLRSLRRQEEGHVHELQLTLGKMSVELEAKENELREKHGVGIELARVRFTLDQPLATAKEQLVSLRQELKKFVGVNLGDIEEYERIRERYQFLADQESDLQQAQTQLRELIAQMDAEMGKRFAETFVQVRSHFQEVFQALFGGGRADLRLAGVGDPLLDGIEILAEPPGKKMQNLSLLSGGERAFTALALLFAILKVKPVPFCVLDEVEAALDEVNVARFAEFLKQFSAETQFIVITHRRGTMEAADVLYGVTMQDTGVSKLVSVRVIDEEAVIA